MNEITNNADELKMTVSSGAGEAPTSVAILSIVDKVKASGGTVESIPSIDYRTLLKAGFKFAYLNGNRNIDPRHVHRLWKDIKDTPVKCFSKHGIVVPLKRILQKPEDCPKFYDEDGKEITLETPNVELYLLIIDGQHREMACKIHQEANMKIDIVEPQGDVINYVQDYNKLQKNWGSDDWRNARLTSGKSECKLYSKSAAIQEQLMCSPKYADYILSFTKDVCRVSDVKKGKDPDVSDESIERGEALTNAIEMRFSQKDTDEYKAARRVEFLDCITHVHNSIDDKNMGNFTRDMKCFIANMPNEAAGSIMENIKSKDFGQAKQTMLSEYKNFITTSDLETMEIQIDSNYQKFRENKVAKDSKPVVKPGTAAELKEQYAKLDAYKAKIEMKKKAEAERKKAERKAIEAKEKAANDYSVGGLECTPEALTNFCNALTDNVNDRIIEVNDALCTCYHLNTDAETPKFDLEIPIDVVDVVGESDDLDSALRDYLQEHSDDPKWISFTSKEVFVNGVKKYSFTPVILNSVFPEIETAVMALFNLPE